MRSGHDIALITAQPHQISFMHIQRNPTHDVISRIYLCLRQRQKHDPMYIAASHRYRQPELAPDTLILLLPRDLCGSLCSHSKLYQQRIHNKWNQWSLSIVAVHVCLSVCLSVIYTVYCTKAAEPVVNRHLQCGDPARISP